MDFDLKKYTILLMVAGSRAYNMAQDTSDVDIKGIAIPPISYYFGFNEQFEQVDKTSHIETYIDYLLNEEKLAGKQYGLEGSIYSINKFFKLASSCNPNILDILFCRDQEIRLITVEGKKLRECANEFLSTKCRWTFSNYALAQLKRINLHRKWLFDPIEKKPLRSDFDLPDDYLIPKNQLEAAEAAIRKKIDSWEIDFGEADSALKVYVENQIAEYLTEVGIGADEKFASAARLIGYDENLIHMLQREREFKQAHTQWKQYQEWKKTRNPKRAALEAKYGFDGKHASHLVRLTRMCREILEKGEVNVWRDDGEELKAIRNGAWTYEQLVEWAEKEDKEMDQLYKTSPLPRKPNFEKLNNLCMELVESWLAKSQNKISVPVLPINPEHDALVDKLVEERVAGTKVKTFLCSEPKRIK